MGDDSAVLVVVVSYNSADLLPRLLESVVDDVAVVEVIVRDNSAGGEAAALVAIAQQFPAVRILAGDNIGFAAGVNAAVRSAELEWTHVWVLNPDARARPGALDALLRATGADGFAVASPLIVTPSGHGDRIWYAGGALDLVRGRTTHGGAGRPVPADLGPARPVSFVTGAAPLVTRAAWQQLGGFSEHYFLYWEDADLSRRAAELGIRLGFVPDAIVDHWQGGSSGGGQSPTYCYYVQRNRLWLAGGMIRRIDVAAGRGGRVTAGHLLAPIRRASRSATPLRSLWASVRGLAAGLRGPRHLR